MRKDLSYASVDSELKLVYPPEYYPARPCLTADLDIIRLRPQ